MHRLTKMGWFYYKISSALLLLSTLTLTLTSSYSSRLSPYYYDDVCPEALPAIKRIVEDAIMQESRMGASLLRLHFHDCFVQVLRIDINIYISCFTSSLICMGTELGVRRLNSSGRDSEHGEREECPPQRKFGSGFRGDRPDQVSHRQTVQTPRGFMCWYIGCCSSWFRCCCELTFIHTIILISM